MVRAGARVHASTGQTSTRLEVHVGHMYVMQVKHFVELYFKQMATEYFFSLIGHSSTLQYHFHTVHC